MGGVASTFAPAGALWGSLYGAGTGSVIGGVGSVMTGGDIKEGIIFGAATGLVGGGIQGYCSAKSQGLNPWTGKEKMPKIPNYDLTLETGDFAENVTLYRKTSGSEGKPGYLFMTDNYEYAQSYVQNGGSVECVVLPRSAIYVMSNNGSGDLVITPNPQIHKINGVEYRGCEYTFSPRVKGLIVPLMK